MPALCSLRRLHCFRRIHDDVQDVTEADLVQLLLSWSNLASLTFIVPHTHSPELLGSIGATCLSLTELEIGGDYYLGGALDTARYQSTLIAHLEENHDNRNRYKHFFSSVIPTSPCLGLTSLFHIRHRRLLHGEGTMRHSWESTDAFAQYPPMS